MSLADNLYEQDYFAWALQQADVLRRREAGANALDYQNLAEEVEDLAKSELRSCKDLLRQIVDHAVKIASADEGQLATVPHCRKEIAVFRDQLEERLTTTLRLRLEERASTLIDRFLRSWREVDREGSAAWRSHPPTLAQCLDEDWFPEAGARTLRPAEPA